MKTSIHTASFAEFRNRHSELTKEFRAKRNRLSKAAPDMLDALKILSVAYMNVRFPDGEPDFLDPSSPLAVARDAIAKAGGG